MKKIIEFHTGRGGRFNNPGHLTFCGIGCDAKNAIENANFFAFENEADIIEAYREKWNESEDENMMEPDDLMDMVTDLDRDVNSDEYREFCEKYGNLGKVVLNDWSGNYIGDYVPDGEEYHYDEDGQYDTTTGTLIEGWEDLSLSQQDAINRSERAYIYDMEFGDRPAQYY